MTFDEVEVFSSTDWPNRNIEPLIRPLIGVLYIWFTKDSAYILTGNPGWTEWPVGKSIAEVLRG